MKKKREIFSINENIYDLFSVEELEKRLQMSAVSSWCSTVTGCGTFECTNNNYTPPVQESQF